MTPLAWCAVGSLLLFFYGSSLLISLWATHGVDRRLSYEVAKLELELRNQAIGRIRENRILIAALDAHDISLGPPESPARARRTWKVTERSIPCHETDPATIPCSPPIQDLEWDGENELSEDLHASRR
jgi:hypothetical protein